MVTETKEDSPSASTKVIERAEEILRYIDDSTQTFVMFFLDYKTKCLEVVSNGNSAEEVMKITTEGFKLVEEDCLEDIDLEGHVDKRLH